MAAARLSSCFTPSPFIYNKPREVHAVAVPFSQAAFTCCGWSAASEDLSPDEINAPRIMNAHRRERTVIEYPPRKRKVSNGRSLTRQAIRFKAGARLLLQTSISHGSGLCL